MKIVGHIGSSNSPEDGRFLLFFSRSHTFFDLYTFINARRYTHFIAFLNTFVFTFMPPFLISLVSLKERAKEG